MNSEIQTKSVLKVIKFMHVSQRIALLFILSLQFLPNPVRAAVSGQLVAGAARIEITPSANAIPQPFTSILDPLYARAIYLDNGHDRAVLLNADVGAISSPTADKVSAQISQELRVPAENILISATHDHSAIFGGPRAPMAGLPAQENSPAEAFEAKLVSGLEKAAKQAHDNTQAAQIGYGEGKLFLNVNRDAIDEHTRLWSQEPNLIIPPIRL